MPAIQNDIVTAGDAAVRRAPRVAVAGLIFSLLFLVGWLLMRQSPTLDDSDDVLVAYYGDADSRRNSLLAGLYVIPLASVAFIWFMAAARERYVRSARREDTILSTAHVVAGAIVVTSLLTLATVELAVVWLAEAQTPVDVDGIRPLLALGVASSQSMALRSAAVFVGISASRSMRSKTFPRSYGVLSMLTAIALLVAYEEASWISLVFPLWVALTSLVILFRRQTAIRAEDA
jgi:hypothetical protein